MLRQSIQNQSVSNAGWQRFSLLLWLATVTGSFFLHNTPAQTAQKNPLPSQPVSAVQFHYLMKEHAAADASARLDAFPARSFERHHRSVQVFSSKTTTPYQRLA